jgi:hypothetical protein
MCDYYAYPDAKHFIGWFKSTMYEANAAFIFVKKKKKLQRTCT